jgi:protein ImuB
LGRVSVAADNPFKKGLLRPPEERVSPPAPLRELSRRTEAAEHPFKPGARGWAGQDLSQAIESLPPHQRPTHAEHSRRSEVVDNPFRPMPTDEACPKGRAEPCPAPGRGPAAAVPRRGRAGQGEPRRGPARRGQARPLP